ncbi:MAG: hypothetical protein ACFFER_12485 [Candidatus Thorarchaeota archaeon]
MNYSNPSVLFLRVGSLGSVQDVLVNLNEVVGIVQTEDGERNRFVRSMGPPERASFEGRRIRRPRRGRLRFEKKIRIDEDPPYEIIKPYNVYYYLFSVGTMHILLIVADRGVHQYLRRLLVGLGLAIYSINLDRRVQSRLAQSRDVTNYATETEDDLEPEIGKMRVVARSSGIDIQGTVAERFVDGRGAGRDQGLTWFGCSSGHKMTFWIYHRGSINVKDPQVNEQHLLELIDLILSVM